MTTLDAVAFLVSAGLVPAGSARLGPDVALTGAAMDTDAAAGAVAWMSESGLVACPGRLAAFAGSLVVVPAGTEAARAPDAATVVPADDPKVVFSILAEHLFPDLLDSGWPAHGDGPVSPDAQIGQDVVLAHGVVIGAAVVLEDGVRIGPNTCLAHTTVEAGAEIGANCSVGLPGFGYTRRPDGTLVRFPHVGRVRIGRGAAVGSNTCIDRGGLGTTVVETEAKVDSLVYLSHNVQIGEGALVVGHSTICGSTTIGARAWIAPAAVVIDHVAVGDDAFVGLGAVVTKPVEAGAVVAGSPARSLPPRP